MLPLNTLNHSNDTTSYFVAIMFFKVVYTAADEDATDLCVSVYVELAVNVANLVRGLEFGPLPPKFIRLDID